jgi:hypothetical protein
MRVWWDRLHSAAVSLRFRLVALLRRRQRDQDLHDELQHHLALFAERAMADGVPASLARRRAILQFGSVGRLCEETRDAGRFVLLADVISDARHGARLLVREPVSTGLAVAILALGIGISVTIFAGPLLSRGPGLPTPTAWWRSDGPTMAPASTYCLSECRHAW